MFKKYKLLILLTLIFIVVLLVLVSRNKKESPPPQVFLNQEVWNEITPGKTNMDSLLKKMGEPADKKVVSQNQTYYYPSNNEFYQHEIEISNNVVSFIKEKVFPPSDRSLENKINSLGKGFTSLNGPNSNSGIFLYAYPENGIALLASQSGDTLYEIWYFPASSLENFLELPQLSSYSVELRQKLD